MAGLVGADVEQLHGLARRFDGSADRLEAMARESTARIRIAQWVGADVDALRSDWDNQSRPSLTSAANHLRDAARKLRREAEAQRSTSSASSGSLGSVGGVAGIIRGIVGGGGIASGGGGGGGGGGGAWSDEPVWTDDVSAEGRVGPQGRHDWSNGGTWWSQTGNVEGEAGAGGSAGARYSFDGERLDASAEAEGWAGARGSVTNEYTVGDFRQGTTVDGLIGADGSGHANITMGPGGSQVDIQGEAFAGARLSADQYFSYGDIRLDKNTTVQAGAWASGEARQGMGPDGYSSVIGYEVGAGVKLSDSSTFSVPGFSVTGTGSVMKGVSSSQHMGIVLGAEEVRVVADVGAAFGWGAGVEIDITANPKQIWESIGGDNIGKNFAYLR